MADLKEETTLDNSEENQVEETVEPKRKAIDPSLEGIQLFYETNKKMITYVGGAVVVILGAFLFLKLYYIPEQEKEASNEMFWAETLFERDSFNLALKGGAMVMAADGQKQMKGFEQIADEFSMTKSGSLANYYAGVCYLRTGKFEQAIPFLEKYDGNDEIISSIAIGAIGDCHMEMNHGDEAIKYYFKAAENSKNNFTTPLYLKKAGLAYELKGSFTDALNVYERIIKEFPSSNEGQSVDLRIAKIKAQANL